MKSYRENPDGDENQLATKQNQHEVFAAKQSMAQAPPEILHCARTLENWMQQNGHRYWALLGVCDRRFAAKVEPTSWQIWSHEHNGWWAPHSHGYVRKRSDAGLYSYEEACKIVSDANYGLGFAPNEAMVLYVPESPPTPAPAHEQRSG